VREVQENGSYLNVVTRVKHRAMAETYAHRRRMEVQHEAKNTSEAADGARQPVVRYLPDRWSDSHATRVRRPYLDASLYPGRR
jgi:hypothetical protein